MLQEFELKTGRLYWRPLGETSWIDFGNVLGHKKTPDLKRLTHNDRRGGIASADADILAGAKWRYTLEFDEHFADVVALQVLSLTGLADSSISWSAAEYVSNFTAGADAWGNIGDANIVLTGNTDAINAENDWLKVERTTNAGPMHIQKTIGSIVPGETRRITLRVFNPGGSPITHFNVSYGGAGASTPIAVAVAPGTAVDLDVIFTYGGPVSSPNFRIHPCDAAGNLAALVAGTIYYVKNVSVQKKTATFAPVIGRSFWLGFYAVTVMQAVTNLAANLIEGTHYTIDPRTGMVTVEALVGAEASWTFNVNTPTLTLKTLQRLSALLTRGTFKLVENDQHDPVPLQVDDFEGQVWVTGWGDDNLEDFNRYQVEVLFTP